IPVLVQSMGWGGLLFLILGGVAYSLGALLYALGAKIKYMHCIFHIFCLAGTILHFFAIYLFLL
ncbi:hemolysin III family protein, partial [Candidatus Saccharibacteria bacterium]|nr:hemolysin III family protein [Candidatus Saccharibacteria bacterium]